MKDFLQCFSQRPSKDRLLLITLWLTNFLIIIVTFWYYWKFVWSQLQSFHIPTKHFRLIYEISGYTPYSDEMILGATR